MKKLPLAVALAAASGVIPVAVAWAAPDRTGVIDASTLEFKWDGGPVTGGGFASADDDDTLIEVKNEGGGTLKVDFTEVFGGDVDLEIYKSNASGEPNGDTIANDSTVEPNGPSAGSVKVAKGFYLVRAVGFPAAAATYSGTAKLTPAVAPAADPAPTETPAGGGSGGSGSGGGSTGAPAPAATNAPPRALIGKLAKTVKAKKLKGFAGTASDDGGVAKVEIALELKKGKKCLQLTAKGTFAKSAKCGGPTTFLAAKGTTKWTFKLRKALKKGSYTLFARATDTSGQSQAGFTAESKRAFKVK